MMFSIGGGIGKIPFDLMLKRVQAHLACCQPADTAAHRQAGVRMDKYLYRVFALLIDEMGYEVYLCMGLLQGIVPGHGDMAIYMKRASVLDHAHIVDVYP